MFENVKLGDKVLVEANVLLDWRSYKYFHILKEVTKVTKTQFTVNGVRYKKDTGSSIGENSCLRAKPIGTNRDGKEIVDQTEERNLFVKKFNLVKKLNKRYIDTKNLDDILLDDLLSVSELYDSFEKVSSK